MAEYLIQDSTLTGIADVIREKTGSVESMTPAQMATEIASIETDGGGGVTITDGVVVNELKTVSNQYIGLVPKSITLYTNGLVPAFALGATRTDNRFYWLETITHIPNAPITYVDTRAFSFCPAVTKEIAESIFANVE